MVRAQEARAKVSALKKKNERPCKGVRELARTTGQQQIPAREVKPNVARRLPKYDKDNGLPTGHPRMTKRSRNLQITTVQTSVLCGRHRLEKGLRKWPTATFSEAQVRRRSFACWCAARSSAARLESARDKSRLRLRPANLRWSHCSWCQVWSLALSSDGRRDNVDRTMA